MKQCLHVRLLRPRQRQKKLQVQRRRPQLRRYRGVLHVLLSSHLFLTLSDVFFLALWCW